MGGKNIFWFFLLFYWCFQLPVLFSPALRVLQFKDRTVIVNPRFFYKIWQGYGFAVSKRFEGVAADGSVDILFLNPSNSGRDVYVALIEIFGLAQLYADIYINNTVTSNGTLIPYFNLNTKSSITPVAEIYHGGAYTLGNLIYNMVVPGGSHIRAVGGGAEIGESIIIGEGVNFILRVTNKSASSTDFSARALWWEDLI